MVIFSFFQTQDSIYAKKERARRQGGFFFFSFFFGKCSQIKKTTKSASIIALMRFWIWVERCPRINVSTKTKRVGNSEPYGRKGQNQKVGNIPEVANYFETARVSKVQCINQPCWDATQYLNAKPYNIGDNLLIRGLRLQSSGCTVPSTLKRNLLPIRG